MQRWREVELASVVAILFVPVYAPFLLGGYMTVGELAPLLWPSMFSDIDAFVTPDECYCPELGENGHDLSNTSCADYAASQRDDVNTPSGCTGQYNTNAAAGMFFGWLAALLCLIGATTCSWKWAKRATANP